MTEITLNTVTQNQGTFGNQKSDHDQNVMAYIMLTLMEVNHTLDERQQIQSESVQQSMNELAKNLDELGTKKYIVQETLDQRAMKLYTDFEAKRAQAGPSGWTMDAPNFYDQARQQLDTERTCKDGIQDQNTQIQFEIQYLTQKGQTITQGLSVETSQSNTVANCASQTQSMFSGFGDSVRKIGDRICS